MEKILKPIKIVEYSENLADAVADMWNNSNEGWGGSTNQTTAEEVRIAEANSSNLKLFLALEEDKVVGYCSLSEYREDSGSLYIPLLNVRPDYHGRKIGKMLVLHAVNETIQRGWPRVDLYTWPGNTKAVPLYKRCGFFWEDRDDTTHLMNFIPSVMQTEVVQPYFNKVDWYNASQREIQVVPDGLEEGSYTYFEYRWFDESAGSLRMQFEKSGRGLRLIETDDYIIEAKIANFELICNGKYAVQFHIKNKSTQPLSFKLKGKDVDNIHFPINENIMIEDEKLIERSFQLRVFVEEQSPWRTHPSVQTDIWINGMKATFGVGIKPILPSAIKAKASASYIGEETEFYLDIENQSHKNQTFSFTLPTSDVVQIHEPSISIQLAGKERTSLPISMTLTQYGFYSPELSIDVVDQEGNSQTFNKKIGIGFPGIGGQFFGECDEYWHMYNGLNHAVYRKFNNEFIVGRKVSNNHPTRIMSPKLGKPYSDEFSKAKPVQVETIIKGSTTILKVHLLSLKYLNILLTQVFKLYAEGFVESYFEVKNKGKENINDLFVQQPVFHKLDQTILSYNNEIVQQDQSQSWYDEWITEKVTENWLFSQSAPYPVGFCWAKDTKMQFNNWYFYFEHNIEELDGEEILKTSPFFMTLGAMQTWQELRQFALKQEKDDVSSAVFEVLCNNGNPVIAGEKWTVEAIQKKSITSERKLEVLLEGKEWYGNDKLTIPIEKQGQLIFPLISGRENHNHFKKQEMLMKPRNDSVSIHKDAVYTVSNGTMVLKASNEFYPCLFSLKKDGVEWFDHSFPLLTAKAWWNPWSGGLFSSFSDISFRSLQKESSRMSEAKVKDSWGNVWSGIKMTTSFEKNEHYKGLMVDQYFLLLSGVPVLAHMSRIHQHTGRFLQKNWGSFLSLKPCKKLDDCYLEHDDKVIYAGNTEIETKISKRHVFSCNNVNDALTVIGRHEEHHAYLNKEIMAQWMDQEIKMKDGDCIMTKPLFLVISDQNLLKTSFKNLDGLTFQDEV
ncbi:GNAT family N-acetyltransferase [Bacillus carboniphilus]|uniref:GNAT family N-acetyltransferase n=1 Tax=Bacillus carboniphilus TaxID=86663 RepID=A0ABY9JXZ8_9BACI|nr:GNAT family N-acetyltransferase [Bacillus carboniphilus]WLR43393.1 GNAT family N-acetyltransferase [Bacillus carboniphilus]